MVKILLCPDSFKGTLTSVQAAQAMARGLEKVSPRPETVVVPMADGGQGTLEALSHAVSHTRHQVVVSGPLGGEVEAHYLEIGSQGIVEMAQAGGLLLIPEEKRDPRRTTTYGVGQLMVAAMERGLKKIVVTLGGSGTNDGGMGMAQALGYRFYDSEDREIIPLISPGYSGASMAQVARIDKSRVHPRLAETDFLAATDVDNPLCGPHGASHVYGPQKGATPEVVDELNRGMEQLAQVVLRDLDRDIFNIPGVGAAGGLGGGLVGFVGASIVSGVEWLADLVSLRDKISQADLVITGEGKIDGQTLSGKTIAGIAKITGELGKPLVAIGGCLGPEADDLKSRGIALVVDASGGVERDMATLQKEAGDLLAEATYRAFLEFSTKHL